MLGDAVAEREQAVGKVDVFKENVAAELDVGEVPDALYTEGDETVGDLLCDAFGHRQHRDGGVIGGTVGVQLVHPANGDAVHRGADDGGGNVESGVEEEAALVEVKVLQQRVTEVARADDDEAALVIHAEDVADLGAQLHDVVAVALLTKFAEAAQILPDLRGGHAHALAERAGRDAHDALGVQLVEVTVVAGKTPDHGVGDLLFFHALSLFSNL